MEQLWHLASETGGKLMRTLLRISMDVDAANHALRDGSLQQLMDSVTELIKPESSYFTAVNGKRTAFFFFDLKDASMIPQIAEPLFQTLRAEVEFSPAMNREELAKGLQAYTKSRKAA
jgi:hypothetical protein